MIGRVRCPKCAADVPDADLECGHCGIVFAKHLKREEPLPRNLKDAQSGSSRISHLDDDRRGLAALLLGVESETTMPVAVGRGMFLLLLGIGTMTLASRGVTAESFMHLPNLVFHEAGHFLFLPFGRFMNVFGGSLTQVLVPLVCAGAFLWQTRDAFGAAFAVWWAGESLTDVAPYINDARDLQLVLLGGRTGAEVEGHDWEYLLNAMGVAHKDHAIAAVVQTIGTLIMIAALVWAAIVVLNQTGVLRSRRVG
jgi:hypothetical protein